MILCSSLGAVLGLLRSYLTFLLFCTSARTAVRCCKLGWVVGMLWSNWMGCGSIREKEWYVSYRCHINISF